jgi:pimeloyl-ACP methyl ester carboxylesterase
MSIVEAKSFEYTQIGKGLVTVVFLNGFRMKYDTWDKVCQNITDEYNVLLYNRLGVGKSSEADSMQVGSVVVDDMNELLLRLDIQRPFLLVAHSFGGVFANLYARTYPDDVLGIVFVDATHPGEVAALEEFKPPAILGAINKGIKSIEKMFYEFKYSEAECMEQTALQIQKAGMFPGVPIAVVSGAKNMPLVPQKGFAVHMSYQEKLLELSKLSKRYLCRKSSHFPQMSEPEIVVTAINETVDKAKMS